MATDLTALLIPRADRMRASAIVDVHVLFVRGEKILLGRRKNTGYQDGKYSLVAGHLESGETVLEAAAREAKEEVGSLIAVADLTCVHVMHHYSGGHRIAFFFTVESWTAEPMNMEPDKCDDLSWFSPNDLPINVVPYVRAAIGCWKTSVWFSTFGWEE